MSLEEFAKNLELEIDDLPPGSLTPEVNYREIESWSSMYALIIIAYVDSTFSVTLTGEDLRNCNSVSDLYNLIKSRV